MKIKVRKSLTLFTCKKTTYIGRPLSVGNKVPSHVNRPVAIVQFVVEAAGVADNFTAYIAPPLAGLIDATVCALDVSRLYLTGAKKVRLNFKIFKIFQHHLPSVPSAIFGPARRRCRRRSFCR